MKKIWVLRVQNGADTWNCIYSVHKELPSVDQLLKIYDLNEYSAKELLYTNSAEYNGTLYVFRNVNFYD